MFWLLISYLHRIKFKSGLFTGLLASSLLLSPVVGEANAGRETINFFPEETPPRLVLPESLALNSAGELAVFDNHLQRFSFFPGEQREEDWNSFLRKEARSDKFRRWQLTEPVEGVWSDTSNFWYYDSELARRSDTVFLTNHDNHGETVALSGPIRSIVAEGESWLIQEPGGIFREQPAPEGNDGGDTFFPGATGEFAGRIEGDLYVFFEGNEVKLSAGGRSWFGRVSVTCVT